MNWELPQFAHIPLIHTIEGKKLSKRDNASTLDDYSKIGIMPDALRNYLLRLGWSYKDKEIFTLVESIKCFNLEGIGKSPSKLDMSRILSMNEHYIKTIEEDELYNHLVEYCEIYKEKIKHEKEEKIKLSLSFLKNKISTISILNKERLEPIVNELIKTYQTNFKGVGQPLRVALTGSKFGPGLYDIIISLGKKEIEKRLSNKVLV
jgi:glutamyl-tRNA synthetase